MVQFTLDVVAGKWIGGKLWKISVFFVEKFPRQDSVAVLQKEISSSSIKCHMSGTFEKRKENHRCCNKQTAPSLRGNNNTSTVECVCLFIAKKERYINPWPVDVNFSIRNDPRDVPVATDHHISHLIPSLIELLRLA